MEEAYNNFITTIKNNIPEGYTREPLTKEEFINTIIKDKDFAKYWGVIVDIKVLSESERFVWYGNKKGSHMHHDHIIQEMNENNVPRKLISLTYNNKIEKIYE